MPDKKQKRDYFLNVMYTAEGDETFDTDNITLGDSEKDVTVLIKDDKLGVLTVKMPKKGEPFVDVNMK